MRETKGNLCHINLIKNMKHQLEFKSDCDFNVWRKQLFNKFTDLIGINNIRENSCELNFEIESKEKKDGYTLIRFSFESEVDAIVPCYLLIPDTGKEKYPVAITLQGHSTGFHNSIGVPKYPGDEDNYPRTCFALQAVKEGYIALAIEQRGLGERRPRYTEFNCGFDAQNAFMLGRTLIGERVWDISKAIDVLSHFKECDLDKILVTGNSGGGTASFYSACFDDRIKLSVPSCAFCSYADSILNILHCGCNFIPDAYRYFEMSDLSALIAPRQLIVIAGKKDDIFPIDGVKSAYNKVQTIYEKAGCKDNCQLVVTSKEHWWCEDLVWPAIRKVINKMGW